MRPVKCIPTPEGGLDLLAYDWASGEFIREWRYFTESYFGRGGDVEQVSQEEFDRHVEALRKRGTK